METDGPAAIVTPSALALDDRAPSAPDHPAPTRRGPRPGPHDGVADVADADPRLRSRAEGTASATPGGPPSRAERNALVEAHCGFVERYVRRYANRGVPRDDLRQTALLALVQAADRFDPERGVDFTTFAGQTIEGTLKRHFRDRTWWVRPPRRIQELHLRLRRADDDLSQRLGRRPTVDELAAEVEADLDAVLEALEAGFAHGALSIDRSPDPEHDDSDDSWIGVVDSGYLGAEARVLLDDLIATADGRTREILRLRFVEGLTQQEIAAAVGISQSYLSRVIRHELAVMRSKLGDP